MKIYTGTSWSKENQERCAELNIGMMSSPVDPVHPDKILPTISVSCDNGAFRWFREKKSFQEDLFYRWISTIEREPDFISVPDIVCGGMQSFNFSLKHIDNIPFKKYFVVQDGMTFDLVYPALVRCDGCFIGGSTVTGKCEGWKWMTAPTWIEKCHSIGLLVHMGRCPGNLRGLDTAAHIGIDSIDVSTLIRHQLLDRVPQMRLHRKEQKRFVD